MLSSDEINSTEIEDDEEKVLCACGCGQFISKYNRWGRKRIFVHGHNRRGKRHSKASKKKMRNGSRKGKNHYFYGCKHPDEVKKKIGASRKKAHAERKKRK